MATRKRDPTAPLTSKHMTFESSFLSRQSANRNDRERSSPQAKRSWTRVIDSLAATKNQTEVRTSLVVDTTRFINISWK
jgi:hypothetical protein